MFLQIGHLKYFSSIFNHLKTSSISCCILSTLSRCSSPSLSSWARGWSWVGSPPSRLLVSLRHLQVSQCDELVTSFRSQRSSFLGFGIRSFALVALLKRGARANRSCCSFKKSNKSYSLPSLFLKEQLDQYELLELFNFLTQEPFTLYERAIRSF